jgi:hypothetical protein
MTRHCHRRRNSVSWRQVFRTNRPHLERPAPGRGHRALQLPDRRARDDGERRARSRIQRFQGVVAVDELAANEQVQLVCHGVPILRRGRSGIAESARRTSAPQWINRRWAPCPGGRIPHRLRAGHPVSRAGSRFTVCFADDGVRVLDPGEWFAAVVPAIDESGDGSDQLAYGSEAAAADGLSGDDPEEDFDDVEPRPGCRGEVQGDPAVARQPGGDFGVLWVA